MLYQQQGITKIELARYYESVAERMMPFVANRFLTLVRCPSGVHKDCFLQRHLRQVASEDLHLVQTVEKGRKTCFLAIDSPRGLIALAQIGVLEIHAWGSPASAPDEPDQMVFDLDPAPDVAWKSVIDTARLLRKRLGAQGLTAFVKTSGGKGLHIVVPLAPGHSWQQVEAFSRTLATELARENPERLLATMSKRQRKGRIFIDYLRNARGSSTVAPYSTRSRPGAPVSAPLAWEELRPAIGPASFTVANMSGRLAALKEDPWAGFDAARAKLPEEA
jgi:bifunctional non-homologous end joining protein LigD